jgi:two-component system cell cycle response regulator
VGVSAVPTGDSRVLIVDDEVVILEILQEQLHRSGYQCILANSAREGLVKLEGEKPALLVTDIGMPDMNGIQLAQAARNICSDLAVIVMTGRSDVGTAISAMRAGADDYIVKPFDFEEMMICIERALDKRRLVIENRNYSQQLEQRVSAATQDLARSNEQLQQAQDYLNRLIQSTVDGILTVSADDQITFANKGAQSMLGYGEPEIIGVNVGDLYVGGGEEARYVRRVLSSERPLQNYETELRHSNGEIVPVSVSVSLVPDAQGRPAAMLLVCKNITEQKRLELELKEMTIRDGLTGLFNLRFFYERLESEIERAKRQKHPLSLLLLDIDKFKTYNDAHGHLEGDRVLREVARCISESTREHVDLGFRYGGDEFTVILPEADEAGAMLIAQRIRESFASRRFDLLTMSIGLMTYEDIHTPRAFIQFTDAMMYDAKRAGGNKVTVYRAEEFAQKAETKSAT